LIDFGTIAGTTINSLYPRLAHSMMSSRAALPFESGRICISTECTNFPTSYRREIRFFAPQGRLVAPIHVKLGVANGHLGPLGCAKFYFNRPRGWEYGPKISKKSTFW